MDRLEKLSRRRSCYRLFGGRLDF